MQKQRGKMTIFFALLLVAQVAFMLIGVEVGWIVSAHGEVRKAADAAALAAVSRIIFLSIARPVRSTSFQSCSIPPMPMPARIHPTFPAAAFL